MRVWRWALAGVLAVATLISALYLAARTSTERRALARSENIELVAPQQSFSPYLNTEPGVRWVGSSACTPCHAAEHETFCHSGMGRSCKSVSMGNEPSDGVVDHPASRRRYQSVRRNGQLWHRELLVKDTKSEPVLLAEYPVRFVIGSGRHSRSWVIEDDGFLMESPLTWYAELQRWDLSPGYQFAGQPGFQREIAKECLSCHVGRVEFADHSLHRAMILEPAISCERCHGPGELHVSSHQEDSVGAEGSRSDLDLTIVNPARLPRELADAVCQQCHLRSNALVLARGRDYGDFQPGRPMQDFRADYRLAGQNASMTVVGQVEQLQFSRCYQESGTLSCLTCHHAHSDPLPLETADHYRTICLQCHTQRGCVAEPQARAATAPAENCVQCHMPRSGTDIPHHVFTQHRIVRRPATEPESGKHPLPAALEPVLPLSRWPEIDQRRGQGLAWLEIASEAQNERDSTEGRSRAMTMLLSVDQAGLRDPVVDTALSLLYSELNFQATLSFANRALSHSQLPAKDRCNALYLKAATLNRMDRCSEAVEVLNELTQLRRFVADWVMWADCSAKLGDESAREAAMLQAVHINPRLYQFHQQLYEIYNQRGDTVRAAWHAERAVP